MQTNKFVFAFCLLLFIQGVCALSNESINAQMAINTAQIDIQEMQSRDIPVNRVNESYQEALQLYSAQMSLESSRKNADYKLVMEYTDDISKIKDSSFLAQDELKIFLETYNSAKNEINLSDMDNDYRSIINSFNDERFEETPALIDKGYDQLSEIQSSQTALKIFYSTASKSVKDFLKDNWITILSTITGIFVLLIIFQNTIRIWRTKRRIYHLNMKKQALGGLIKRLQRDYFKTKKLSSLEYKTKLKTFNNMILEINRQIPLLKVDVVKLKKPKKN